MDTKQRTVILKWLRPRHDGPFDWLYQRIADVVRQVNQDVWGWDAISGPEDFELAQYEGPPTAPPNHLRISARA